MVLPPIATAVSNEIITKKIYGQGKRVFKMAPFHHHLELCGWSENRIVITFSLVTALFGVIAYFGMGI